MGDSGARLFTAISQQDKVCFKGMLGGASSASISPQLYPTGPVRPHRVIQVGPGDIRLGHLPPRFGWFGKLVPRVQ